jgi:hypothetical protein
VLLLWLAFIMIGFAIKTVAWLALVGIIMLILTVAFGVIHFVMSGRHQ